MFSLGSHILYIDTNYVVMRNPTNGNYPTLISRTFGGLDISKVERILAQLKMKQYNSPYQRDDKRWCIRLQEIKSYGEDEGHCIN